MVKNGMLICHNGKCGKQFSCGKANISNTHYTHTHSNLSVLKSVPTRENVHFPWWYLFRPKKDLLLFIICFESKLNSLLRFACSELKFSPKYSFNRKHQQKPNSASVFISHFRFANVSIHFTCFRSKWLVFFSPE